MSKKDEQQNPRRDTIATAFILAMVAALLAFLVMMIRRFEYESAVPCPGAQRLHDQQLVSARKIERQRVKTRRGAR